MRSLTSPHPVRGPLLLGLALTAGAAIRPGLGLTASYGDNDDAMRLQAVRDLLGGQGWSDLIQHRMAPPAGLESHWSRLVDAPIALLMAVTRPFLGVENAELFVRAAWPLMLFALALWLLLHVANRFGGVRAAWAAAVIAPFTGFVWMQFVPGRIDHHNVQLALAAGMLFCATDLGARRNAALIGAMAALSAAVGLESVGVIAWSALVYLALAVFRPEQSRATVAYGASFAGVAALAYVVQTPPAWWARTGCDALALNGLVGAMLAGGGMALAALRPQRTATGRALAVGGALALAAVIAVALHPSCIRGPYADIDPRIVKIWLPVVEEAEPWFGLLLTRPVMALSGVMLPFGALIYAAYALHKGERDQGFIAACGMLVIATAVGMLQARGLSCANLAAIPLAAAGLTRLSFLQKLTPRLAGLVAGAAASPTIIYSALLFMLPVEAGASAKAVPDCTKIAYFAPLQNQPPGIVFGDLNSDAHILAATQHAVAGGPYHRLGQPIYEAMTLFFASPEKAAETLARNGSDYLALCRASARMGAAGAGTLGAALLEGPAPAWAIPLSAPGAPVAVFRIDRRRLTGK